MYVVLDVLKVPDHDMYHTGSSQSPSIDYVYVGTPEETLLETYFVMLAKFNFDKAKNQCVSGLIENERVCVSFISCASTLM